MPEPSVEQHNQVLRRAEKRADELEEKMVDVLLPLLDRAADEAARSFEQYATDHLTASAILRDRDEWRLAMLGGDARQVLTSLVLSASAVTPGSTMIALYPRPEEALTLAVDGGEAPPVLHVTLAFLGSPDPDSLYDVIDLLRQVASEHAPLVGNVGGVGSFLESEDGAPAILLPDVPGLVELRQCLVECLAGNGVDYARNHGYTPHMTLAYGDGETPDRSTLGQPLHFDSICLVRGDEEIAEIPLSGPMPVTAASYPQGRERHREAASGVRDSAEHRDGQPVPDQLSTDAEREARQASRERQDDVRAPGDMGRGERPATSRTGRSSPMRAGALPQPRPPDDSDRVGALEDTRPEADDLQAAQEAVRLPERPRNSRLPPLQTGSRRETQSQEEAITAAGKLKFCLTRELRGKTDPVRLAVVETVTKAAVENVGLAWDVTNPFIDKALSKSASQIEHIAKTTQADVMKTIRQAYEQGYSIPDTAELIRQDMKRANPARARLIARTELAGAVNGGSLAATQFVSEALGVEYYKRWLTAPGAHYPRHEDYEGLNGQTVRLDDLFEVGDSDLTYPGDPDGDPGEVCNCRCTLVYTDDPGALTADGSNVSNPIKAMIAAAEKSQRCEHVGEYLLNEPLIAAEYNLAMTHPPVPWKPTLVAAGPATWTAPAAEEVLSVNCTGNEFESADFPAVIPGGAHTPGGFTAIPDLTETELVDVKAALRNPANAREEKMLATAKSPNRIKAITAPSGKVAGVLSYRKTKSAFTIVEVAVTRWTTTGKRLIEAVAADGRAENLPVYFGNPLKGAELRLAQDLGFEEVEGRMTLMPSTAAPVTERAPRAGPRRTPTAVYAPERGTGSATRLIRRGIEPMAPYGISQSTLARSELQAKEIEASLSVLDRVFVRFNENATPLAKITLEPREYVNQGTFHHAGPTININPMGYGEYSQRSSVANTVWHEWGHYVDFNHLNAWNLSDTAGAARPEDWRAVLHALHHSQAYAKMQGFVYPNSLSDTGFVSDAFARYLSKDEELFARAFAQYVTDLAEELPNLSAEERKAVADSRRTINARIGDTYGSGWTPTDFAPIKKAFDRLFRNSGYIERRRRS